MNPRPRHSEEWPADLFRRWRGLATGTARAGLCLIHHHQRVERDRSPASFWTQAKFFTSKVRKQNMPTSIQKIARCRTHLKFCTSKVRKYAYVNPAGCTSFFSLSRTIRALSKFQMCRVCHGGCVVRLFRMNRRESPPGRAQTGGHDDPTFVTSAP